jgi:acid phosphatase type 7
MRARSKLLALASLALVGVAASCGSGAAPAKPAAGDDAGTDQAFSYTANGCAYAVAPPATRAFASLALDDGSPVGDPTAAAPARVRIGLGGGTTSGAAGYADPSTTAAFTWQTAESNKAAKVRLGTDPNTLTEIHAGYVWTTPPPSSGFGTNEPETYMHEVHVCGLKPGTTYSYQVGGGGSGKEAWSATQSFTTVPATGPVTVGFFGDARDKVDTWRLVHTRMRDAAVNIQLITGDIVDIGVEESLYETWLDAAWKDPATPGKFLTLGQQMMVPIAGNHENDAARFYANFAIPGDGAYAEQYASFNVGSAHFIMIDDQPLSASVTSDASVTLLKWLEDDLVRADADRAKHPFVVALNHRGLFTTSLHANDGDIHQVRGALAPIFDKHHVDIVLNGHDHEYERSKPLRAGSDPTGAPVLQQTTAQGTVYIVNAGAGADPYAVGTYVSTYREKTTQFGAGTPYVGCYGLIKLEAAKLTLKSYGLKVSGGSVAGDDELDTLELTH